MKRAAHRAAYDALFDLYFPAAVGAYDEPDAVEDDDPLAELDPTDAAAMREMNADMQARRDMAMGIGTAMREMNADMQARRDMAMGIGTGRR